MRESISSASPAERIAGTGAGYPEAINAASPASAAETGDGDERATRFPSRSAACASAVRARDHLGGAHVGANVVEGEEDCE